MTSNRTYFAVIRERGPAWDSSRSLREQESWDEYAAFMDGLVDDGFVLLGGPLGDGERVLLFVYAASESEIRARLSTDLWEPMGLLRTASVEPWQVLLGDPAAVRRS